MASSATWCHCQITWWVLLPSGNVGRTLGFDAVGWVWLLPFLFWFGFHSSNLISLLGLLIVLFLSLSFPISLTLLWSLLLCLLSSSYPCKSFLLGLSAYSPFSSTACFEITLDLDPPKNLLVCLSAPGVRGSRYLSRSQEATQGRKGELGFIYRMWASHGHEDEDQEKTRRYHCEVGSLGAQTGLRILQKINTGFRVRESIPLPEVT